jgi:hypothetical protein
LKTSASTGTHTADERIDTFVSANFHVASLLVSKANAQLALQLQSTEERLPSNEYVDVLPLLLYLCRVWFNIAAATFGANCVIMAYLTVWLPYVQRITLSWNVYCPRAIPTATAVGVVCALR